MADEKSRIEKILEALLGYDIVPEEPQSRIEVLLCQLLEQGLSSPDPAPISLPITKSKTYITGVDGVTWDSEAWYWGNSFFGGASKKLVITGSSNFIPENAIIVDMQITFTHPNINSGPITCSIYELRNKTVNSGSQMSILSPMAKISLNNYQSLESSKSYFTVCDVGDLLYIMDIEISSCIIYYIETQPEGVI